MADETPGVVVTPPKTTEEALAKARSYMLEFAKESAELSYGKEPEAVEPEAEVEPEAIAPVTPEEEPAEVTPEEEEPAPEVPSEKPEEPDEEETAVAGLAPEIQESINKRIGKEVAKTKAEREAKAQLEAKLTELQASLEQLKAAPPETRVVKTDNPLAAITDLKELAKKKEQASSLHEQVTDLLENVEDDPEAVATALKQAQVVVRDESGQEDYSVGRMRKTLRQIDKNIRKELSAIPEREAHLIKESQILSALQADIMPELKDPSSERSKIWNSLKAKFPEVMLNPEWPILLMGSTMYLEAMQKANITTGATPPKPKTPPPKIPAKPKSAPVAVKAKEAKAAELKKMMVEGKTVQEQRDARVGLLQQMLEEKL